MAKKCSYCNTNSVFAYFPLCKDCLEKSKKNLIEKCECGKWIDVNSKCECGNFGSNYEEIKEINLNNINSCILCGDESNGYHFCKKCYNKYKTKDLVLKICNCSRVEVLESNYIGHVVADDGHIVKSLAEKNIDDYLYRNNIKHAYEYAYPIDDNKEHDIHPDFYLPDKDIYIEHFGFEPGVNSVYDKEKEYKLNIYKRDNVTVICTNQKEITNDVNAVLNRKLKFYNKNTINFDK